MSTQRGYAAAATYNAASGPAVLVVGGGNGARWFDSADAYDVATKQWRSCAPLSVRRGSLAAATVHDSIFVFGGGHAGEGSAVRTTTGVASTERYDAARDAWIELAPLSCGRFAIGGAALGGALYAAGGFDGTSYLETVERFDPREGVWRPLPPMPAGRRGSVALAPAPGSAGEHTLVAAGGFSGDAGAGAALFLERVEAFDARANAWRSLAELARPRAYGTAVNVDGRLILLGGLHHQAYAETLEEYDAAADVWRPLTLAGGATRKRSFVTATVVPAL
jgi:N-acetylneuraminic acid mutarotase